MLPWKLREQAVTALVAILECGDSANTINPGLFAHLADYKNDDRNRNDGRQGKNDGGGVHLLCTGSGFWVSYALYRILTRYTDFFGKYQKD